ncbi:Mediator of RNA polymerase II transcription subunit 13 [Madurella mycetomatis]|uniref:Mediator of RNA polymerase II transcription subunit 13 n=1 Tax=Madurella mycetomatis TaxID=100816 RepID=A0A150ASL2_9PEZI|nr:Mediator of RNA polymerase II transcription subunit 13 [Madurella mycetomatis]
MDAGEYETNTLLINNLSAISFRIYEPIASQSSTYTFNASDVEDALRTDGHLVYMDAVRRGIWCFYLSSGDPATPNCPETLGLHARMEVCGYPLGLAGDGSLEPIGLLKSRPPGPSSITTPSSSSSTGSALEMTMRCAQTFNLPPAPAVVDGKVTPNPVADVKGYGSVPAREIHEFFITAVLSSLTTYFCRKIGAIVLNHRTLLLPQQAFNPGDADSSQPPLASALAAFRVYLTTTGSLVISLHVSILHGLVSSADMLRSSLLPAGPVVLAAPFGAFGALQGVIDTDNQFADNNFGQSPDTQISRLGSGQNDRFSQWKTTCCKLLQMRGMSPSLLDGCSWLNIHFLQRKPYEQRADGKRTPLVNSGPTAPWPAVLCFRKPKLDAMLDVTFDKALSAAGGDHSDPLSKAKVWYCGMQERAEAIARRKKEREAILAREREEPDTRNPQGNGYSPMALWRSTNGGPAPQPGAMYPTPPDGVHPSGVTPGFDGAAVLSPAGQPAANALGDADTAMQQSAPVPDGFNVGWDGQESRPDPVINNFAEENIFGDLGENMFEGNELTDADFNFFDEQPVAIDLDMPTLSGGMPTLEMQENAGQTFAEHIQAASGVEDDKADTRPASPQFTKPELKHARSTLAEESRQQNNIESFNRNSAIGIKRHPSPFNPETVYKRIRASIHTPAPSVSSWRGAPRRRPSLFDKVDFDPALSLASKKYEESGPFDFRLPALKDRESRALQNVGPLTTGRLLGSARQRRNLKELPSSISSLLAKMASANANNSSQRDDAASDSDDSSWASDDDGASDPLGRASSPAKSSVLRKRPDDDVISMAASFKELDNISADSPGYGPPDLSRLSNSEILEFSLPKYFVDPEPVPLRISVSDDDFITVAQILTEQAATGFLKLTPQLPRSSIQDVRRNLIKALRYSVRGLKTALPRSLAGAVGCQLRPFTEVQDVPLLVQPNGRVQVRPAEPPKSSIFTIPAPHVELRRYDSQLSVLPSAVSFWETLGLRPVQGSKDIVAMCILPHAEAMRDNASAFLDRVQSTYESLGLGTFETLPTAGSIVNGLVLLTADQDIISPGLNITRARSAFTDQMASLAMTLANSSMTEKNFVVYFAYSPDTPSSIVDSCSAFQELFEHYKRCMMDRKKAIANDLVLQLVPLDILGSETSLFVLSPSDCSRLCLETYDRCTLFGGPMPSPAIMLERALPRGIDFKLSAAPSPNLLREYSCMHVAYARSVDERWVTAAWTDNRGSSQTMASYCLGRRGRPLSRQLIEVMQEIWETTHDLISSCKVHWRIVITKCGSMDQQEIEQWMAMAQAETRSAVSLILLTVDTDPSLQLIPPAAVIPLSAPSVFYTTPVSTPQPFSVVSPDQTSNNPATPMAAATPSGGGGGDSHPSSQQQLPHQTGTEQQDVDMTLVETTETTHGVVISHRLNNSASLTDLNPALASGYLVKRSGPKAEDPPALMEVNVVYSDNTRAMYDALLREMLMYFRGLGTLARVRGVVEREHDVRPWHVAVVEKAVRGLYLLM